MSYEKVMPKILTDSFYKNTSSRPVDCKPILGY